MSWDAEQCPSYEPKAWDTAARPAADTSASDTSVSIGEDLVKGGYACKDIVPCSGDPGVDVKACLGAKPFKEWLGERSASSTDNAGHGPHGSFAICISYSSYPRLGVLKRWSLSTPARSSPAANVQPQFDIRKINFQSVDMFGPKVGFVKFETTCVHRATKASSLSPHSCTHQC